VEGTSASMLAAQGKLFVVTKEGAIHCFGGEKTEQKVFENKSPALAATEKQWSDLATEILDQTEASNGYGLVLGIGSGSLVEELLRQSQLQIIAIDPDANKVNALRRHLNDLGLYGTRAVARVADPLTFEFPPYLAHLVVSEDLAAAGSDNESLLVKQVFHALRPYGGTACLQLDSDSHSSFAKSIAENSLVNAEVKRVGRLSL